MSAPTPSTRRDKRHALLSGTCFVEFAQPDSGSGTACESLTRLSVAGFAFETEQAPEKIPPGMRLVDVRLVVGPCVLQGEAEVRSTQSLVGSNYEIGCLFYPATRECEDRWLAVVAGLEAAAGT